MLQSTSYWLFLSIIGVAGFALCGAAAMVAPVARPWQFARPSHREIWLLVPGVLLTLIAGLMLAAVVPLNARVGLATSLPSTALFIWAVGRSAFARIQRSHQRMLEVLATMPMKPIEGRAAWRRYWAILGGWFGLSAALAVVAGATLAASQGGGPMPWFFLLMGIAGMGVAVVMHLGIRSAGAVPRRGAR